MLNCCKYYNKMSNKIVQIIIEEDVVKITPIKLNKSIDFL